MTREDASKLLSWIEVKDMNELVVGTWYANIDKELREALDMAITALKQETCEDAISREALLKMQYKIDDSATLSTRDVVNVEDIEDLPPITLKQRTGHWIDTGSGQECSECGEIQYGYDSFRKYCANCGAKMGG